MRTIGVIAGESLAAGVVEGNRLASAIRRFHPSPETPARGVFRAVAQRDRADSGGEPIGTIGVGVPASSARD